MTTLKIMNRAKATLLCRKIRNDLDVLFSNRWTISNPLLEPIDQRIRDILLAVLNEGQSHGQICGPVMDKDDEAATAEAHQKPASAARRSQYIDKGRLSDAKALVGNLRENPNISRSETIHPACEGILRVRVETDLNRAAVLAERRDLCAA